MVLWRRRALQPVPESPPESRPPGWTRLSRRAPSVVSALLCFGLTVCYLVRPDACAAITIIPAWAWLAPGLLLSAIELRSRGARKGWPVGAAWFAFFLLLAEEPRSLGRALLRVGY